MNLWQTRQKSLEWLTNELNVQSTLVDEGFEFLDKCISLLNQYSKKSNDDLNGRFARVVNLTLAKTRNLLLGNYSMMLYALAEEAGALDLPPPFVPLRQLVLGVRSATQVQLVPGDDNPMHCAV